MGIPPSGRSIALEVMDVVRVRDGQIVEHWNVVDRMSLLRQLGARNLVRFVGHRVGHRVGSSVGSRVGGVVRRAGSRRTSGGGA